MNSWLPRLLDLAGTVGWPRALSIAARWLLLREYVVLSGELRPPLPETGPVLSLRWTDFSPADIPRLHRLNPALSVGEIRRRLQENQTCLIGWVDGSPVHYRWDTRRLTYLPYLRRRLRPRPGDTFLVEGFTAPAFRDRGLASTAVRIVLARAAAAGCTRFLTLVAAWNAPSLRTCQKAGLQPVGTVGCRVLGPCRRYFATGQVHFDQDGTIHLASAATGPAPERLSQRAGV
jgi:GNAT superfamily N-acetyltransferase